MKLLAALLFLLLGLNAAIAQQVVRQSGKITPGHVSIWVTTGVIKDGGLPGLVNSVVAGGNGSLSISPTTGNVIASCTTATVLQLGCVKPDGSTITVSGGIISAVGGSGAGVLGGIHACNSHTGPPYSVSPVNICEFDACFITAVCTSTQTRTAIQAAIDYAATVGSGSRSIYCPAGSYGIDIPLFLDVPGNLRGTYFGGTAITYIGTYDPTHTYSLNDAVTYQGIPWVSLQNSNIGHTPVLGSQFSITSPFWKPTTASPLTGNPALTFYGDEGLGAQESSQGCQILALFVGDTCAFWSGPGNGMEVKSIQLLGSYGGDGRLVGAGVTNYPAYLYRGGQYPNYNGLCIAGGGPGANRTLIQSVESDNFDKLLVLAPNYNALGAENKIVDFNGLNGHYGIVVGTSQAYINSIVRPSIYYTTNAVYTSVGPSLSIPEGGNMSAHSAAYATIPISATSGLTPVTYGGNWKQYSFSTTLNLPSAVPSGQRIFIDTCGTNIGNCILDTWMVVTKHFGIVPLSMTAYTSSTTTATFITDANWSTHYWQISTDASASSDLAAEIQAATVIYATEKVTTIHEAGGVINALHMENDQACTTFINGNGSFDTAMTVTDVLIDNDPSLSIWAPAPFGFGNLPWFYCQQSFPFIWTQGANIAFNGNTWESASIDPVVLDFSNSTATMSFNYNQQFPMNPITRVNPAFGYFGQNGYISGAGISQYTTGFGAGAWNPSPWGPTANQPSLSLSGGMNSIFKTGIAQDTFTGYRPALSSTPRIPVSMLNNLTPQGPVTVTYTSGSPGVVTWGGGSPTAHNLSVGAPVAMTCTGGGCAVNAAFAVCTASSPCYVQSVPLSTTFTLSLTLGGAAINTSGTGTGTQQSSSLTRRRLGADSAANGMTNYSVLDWNAQIGKFAQSAHYFDSWGQPLNTNVVPTMHWAAKGQSFVVLADFGSLGWVYPGLGITLSTDTTTQYMVTGVFPHVALDPTSTTITFTNPATVNWTGAVAAGVVNGMTFFFSGGVVPTGLAANTSYYVAGVSTNSFTLVDLTGAAVTFSTNGSGTITGTAEHPGYFTVLNASQDGCPCQISGDKNTVYTGTSIGQGTFSWKALTYN